MVRAVVRKLHSPISQIKKQNIVIYVELQN